LITISKILAIARTNAPKGRCRSLWDSVSPVSAVEILALSRQLDEIANDRTWHHYECIDFDSVTTVRLVSDSSGTHGAYVVFTDDGSILHQHNWKWDSHASSMSIFLKELLAATMALEFASSLGRPIHLAVDNSAACFVLRRGLSLNASANEMLQRVFKVVTLQRLQVSLIRSADNAADPLTRQRPLDNLRNQATLERMSEAESGWPKTKCQPAPFISTDDADGESDSDWNSPRHRESNEDDDIIGLSCGDCSDEDDEE
jgi:hypothetical protein